MLRFQGQRRIFLVEMGEVLLAWRDSLGSGVGAILREVPVRLDTG